MAFRIKKTISGQKGKLNVTQLSKNQRNMEGTGAGKRRGRPKLILTSEQYLELSGRLARLLKQAHPDWPRERIRQKLAEALKPKK
jgi:hypothetical protein